MRVRSIVLCFAFLFAVVISGRDEPRADSELSLAKLRAELSAHVNQERFRGAEWGIKIVSLESGAVVFELNPAKLLKPASNAKLYTGALALDVLGADYRIRTSLYATAASENGVLKGDLIVYGRGDPSFSTRFEKASYTNLFGPIVEAIRGAGIRKIDGDLVGDSTFFSGPPYGTGWNWDDLQYYYGAEVTALCVQDNTLDLLIRPGDAPGQPCGITQRPATDAVELVNRTGTSAPKSSPSITIERLPGQNRVFVKGSLPKGYGTWNDSVSVPNPTLWFVTLLREELAREGIIVAGRPRAVRTPEQNRTDITKLRELASVTSPPLQAIVRLMMKASQNLYAQLLLLQVGVATKAETNDHGTEESGVKRLREFDQRAGIFPGDVLLDDGAGLSRSGLVTARATVQLLRYMSKHKHADIYRGSLPEAGTDGTLRTRLKELKGKLRAKTGTLRFVNALSGYLTTSAGEELAFCIMLNGYNSGESGRDEIDVIPRLVARLKDRVNDAVGK